MRRQVDVINQIVRNCLSGGIYERRVVCRSCQVWVEETGQLKKYKNKKNQLQRLFLLRLASAVVWHDRRKGRREGGGRGGVSHR